MIRELPFREGRSSLLFMQTSGQSKALPSVFVIGDSISLQYGPYLERYLAGSWNYDRKRGEAEALLNLDNPQGANGGDSSMVLSYLQSKLEEPTFRPDVLLLNCGLHDIKRRADNLKALQIEPDQYRENLEKIVQIIPKNRIRLVWIRTTPVVTEIHNRKEQRSFLRFCEDCESYNVISDGVMSRAGIPIIDLAAFTLSLGEPEEIFVDHVHYKEPFRALQAAFLAGWLSEYKNSLV